MSDKGGDTKFGFGRVVTLTYNNADNGVDPAGEGMWVMIDTNDYEVDTAESTNNTDLDGVLADEVAASSKEAVQFDGVVWARVESGVGAGAELAPGTTAGVAASGGTSGHVTLAGATELVSGSGEYFAPVKLGLR